jgi:hypothetical protein
VIVKSLVTESPGQTINNISIGTLEKTLVDIFFEGQILADQQGSEMPFVTAKI